MPSLPPSTVLTAITSFAAKYDKTLIAQMLNGLKVANDLKLRTGVKNKLHLRKMTFNAGVRKYNSNVTVPKNPQRQGTERVLEVQAGMKIFRMIMKEYFDAFADEMAGINPPEIPFAAWIWEQEFMKLADEINETCYFAEEITTATDFDATLGYSLGDYVIFTGNGLQESVFQCDDASGTNPGETPISHPAKWVDADARSFYNGLGTIAAADLLSGATTASITGATTSSNTFQPIVNMYNGIPERVRRSIRNVWVSENVYQEYLHDADQHFAQQSSESSGDGIKFVWGSDKTAQIRPASWLKGSRRIWMEKPGTMQMGTNSLDDFNEINEPVKTLHGYDAIAQFLLGFQVADWETCYISDQV